MRTITYLALCEDCCCERIFPQHEDALDWAALHAESTHEGLPIVRVYRLPLEPSQRGMVQ